MLIFLMSLPFISFFAMLVLLATYGEIVINKNGLEEWIICMVVITVLYGFKRVKSYVKRKKDEHEAP